MQTKTKMPSRIFPIGKLAARESSRYAVNGIQIHQKDNECRALATDGRRLVEARWHADEAETSEVLIPLENWLLAMKMAKTHKAVDVGIHDKRITVTETIAVPFLGEDEDVDDFGVFPNTDPVFRDSADDIRAAGACCVAVNPKYLIETVQTLMAVSGNNNPVVLSVPTNPARPLSLAIKCGEDGEDDGVARAVLMPVTLDCDAVLNRAFHITPEHKTIDGNGEPITCPESATE